MGTSIFSNPSVVFDHLPSHKSNLGKCARRYFVVDIFWRQQHPGPRLAWASDVAGWPFFLSHLCGEITLKLLLSFLEPPPKGHAQAPPGATPVATPGATPGPPWGNACGKHFTKNPPEPQKVASRVGETPTCENEIVSGVGPNSFPKWGPQYLATLPSFLTTCPHINQILENALGDIF